MLSSLCHLLFIESTFLLQHPVLLQCFRSPLFCFAHSILKIFFNKSDVSVVRLQFSDALINACLIAKTLQLFHRELLELGFACPSFHLGVHNAQLTL